MRRNADIPWWPGRPVFRAVHRLNQQEHRERNNHKRDEGIDEANDMEFEEIFSELSLVRRQLNDFIQNPEEFPNSK